MPMIPACRELRQVDHWEFKANLGTEQDSEKEEIKEEEGRKEGGKQEE